LNISTLLLGASSPRRPNDGIPNTPEINARIPDFNKTVSAPLEIPSGALT
jgi:hypothetical protein